MNTNCSAKRKCIRWGGCAMEVLNTLRQGQLEKPYENALAVEFNQQGIHFAQQPRFSVTYKSVNVGEYILDLIVAEKVIVDTKVIEKIVNNEKAPIINYLKITGLRVGLILNFTHAKLDWQRVVL